MGNNHGGVRPGAGRKNIHGPGSEPLYMRIPNETRAAIEMIATCQGGTVTSAALGLLQEGIKSVQAQYAGLSFPYDNVVQISCSTILEDKNNEKPKT